MCHCFGSPEELSDEQREELLAEHSEAELREAYDEDELLTLGVAA